MEWSYRYGKRVILPVMQLLAEVIGVLANVIYVGLISFVVFKDHRSDHRQQSISKI